MFLWGRLKSGMTYVIISMMSLPVILLFFGMLVFFFLFLSFFLFLCFVLFCFTSLCLSEWFQIYSFEETLYYLVICNNKSAHYINKLSLFLKFLLEILLYANRILNKEPISNYHFKLLIKQLLFFIFTFTKTNFNFFSCTIQISFLNFIRSYKLRGNMAELYRIFLCEIIKMLRWERQ